MQIDNKDVIAMSKMASVCAHVKENNVAYLVGVLIAYQIGILEKVFEYGAGMC